MLDVLERVRRPLSIEKWIENLFRPTVITGMMSAVVISVVALVHRVNPTWGGAYLVGLVFVVVWEAIQSERVLKHSPPGDLDRVRFRLTEWVIIMLCLKFARYLEFGPGQLWADIPRWFRNLGTFFDAGYLMETALVFLLWQLGIFLAQDLYVLEVHPSELRPSSTSAAFYLWLTQPRAPVNRGAALRVLMIDFFTGGLLLVICTGLARFDIPLLFPDRPPPLSGLVINAMAYFLLGLVLINQAYYSVLQSRWQLQELEVAAHIGGRWAVMAAVFMAVVVAVALLLPTGYSMGLPQAISLVVSTAVMGIMYVIVALLGVLVIIINFLISLFFGREQPGLQAPESPALPAVAPGATPSPGNPLWGMARDLLLWALLLGIVAYSFYGFLGDRRHLLRGLFVGGPLAWLRRLWRGLFAAARQASGRAGQQVREGFRRLFRLGRQRPPWGYLSLSSLSPRRLLLYFYLSIVHRAGEQGLARRPWQTPYEYSQELRSRLPERESDVAEVTEAFVFARYSPQPVPSEKVGLVKLSWTRLRGALRGWRLLP